MSRSGCSGRCQAPPDSLALPSMAPARYWPRTVLLSMSCAVNGLSARSTLIFSSRTASGSMLPGGSMARIQSSCSRWFCTMSRAAPVPS